MFGIKMSGYNFPKTALGIFGENPTFGQQAIKDSKQILIEQTGPRLRKKSSLFVADKLQNVVSKKLIS